MVKAGQKLTPLQYSKLNMSGLALGRGYFKGKPIHPKVKASLAKSHKDMIGEKAPNWRGGTSRPYKDGYYSIEYKNWRKAVFERDGYTCQGCGDQNYITAHHIKGFAKHPELRYDVSNGLTLCEKCHAKTDNYKGRARRR